MTFNRAHWQSQREHEFPGGGPIASGQDHNTDAQGVRRYGVNSLQNDGHIQDGDFEYQNIGMDMFLS